MGDRLETIDMGRKTGELLRRSLSPFPSGRWVPSNTWHGSRPVAIPSGHGPKIGTVPPFLGGGELGSPSNTM